MVSFSDDFNSLNINNTIGNLLPWTITTGSFNTFSNKVDIAQFNTICIAHAEVNLSTLNQEVQSEINTFPNTGIGVDCQAGVCARVSQDGNTFYMARIKRSTNTQIALSKCVNGTITDLATDFILFGNFPNTIKLRCITNGSNVDLYLFTNNGTSEDLFFTDTSSVITNNYKCGIYAYDNASGGGVKVRFDDFSAMDYNLLLGDSTCPLTNYGKNKLLNDLFGKQSYVPSDTLYIALSYTTPRNDGTNFVEPENTLGYNRIPLSNNKTFWSTASNGVIFNNQKISFGSYNYQFGSPTHIGIFDAASSGNLLLFSLLNKTDILTSGNSLSLPSGAVVLRMT